jgi:hypothetical protein
MKRHIGVFWSLVALLLSALVLTGTALAGDGGGNGNGNGGTPPGQGGTPPGQEKKAESPPAAQPATPAQPASNHGQAKKEQQAKAAKHETKSVEHAAKKSVQGNSEPTRGKSAEAHHHVIICHRTGSATNPYVVINISNRGWINGHQNHPDLDGRHDILLKDHAAPGEKGPDKSVCTANQPSTNVTAPAAVQEQKHEAQSCPSTTTTVTEQVLAGVWHKTGSKKNPWVWLTPSTNSAHYDSSKHEDDRPDQVPVFVTVTKTTTTANCATTTSQTTAAAAPAAVAPAAVAPAAAAPTSGVAGTTATIDFPPNVQGMPVYVTPSAGGVAGVSATLPTKAKPKASGALAATRTSGGTLPFTGLALLGLVLAGAILVTAGWAIRRRAVTRRLAP